MDMEYTTQEKFTKDDTPVRKYSLTLSERDIKSLNSLKSRNFSALILPVANEYTAIIKIVNQLHELSNEDEKLDNYD
tara:strand:- start:271 stop:501 length:231 start_codon:yes stop_codon:yes gene_type:complete